MDSKELSDNDIMTLENLLKRLKPGFLPLPIFHQVARLTTVPIIEVVPLRRNSKSVEVLLLEREKNDPVWPSQLHVPGTVIRSTDTMNTAFTRILANELGYTTDSEPTFVQNILHHSGRGLESSQVYWINITDKPVAGEFYDVENLPETLVKSQLDFIPQAVADFCKHY